MAPPARKPAGYLLAKPAGRAREWWREIGGMGNKSPRELAPDPPKLPGVGGPGRGTTRRGTAGSWQVGKNTLLGLQRKRGHGRRARPTVSCTCDGERTNRDNKSSDNGEYDL